MLLDQILVLVAKLVRALVSSSELLGPLVVFDRHATVLSISLRVVHALITFAIHLVVHAGAAGRQILTQLEALSSASQHVMQLPV